MRRKSNNYRYGVLFASWVVSVLLLGAVVYALLVGQRAGREVLDRSLGEVLVSVVVVDSLPGAEVETLCRVVESIPQVISVRSISSAEAMSEFIRMTGHKPMMDIRLPASIEVRVNGGAAEADRLAVRLKGDKRVAEVVYDLATIASREQTETVAGAVARYMTWAIGAIVVWLLVAMSGMWASYERRGVVFGRLFVVGALAGLAAAVLLAAADWYLRQQLGVGWLVEQEQMLFVASSQVIASGVLGLILGYVFKQVAR